MEQLAHMKRRIKAVETIKKVTHAMRLISMSAHTKLQEKQPMLATYKNTFLSLWASVHPYLPPEKNNRLSDPHHLIILIGSQKGLVGTFNTNLYKQLEKDHPSFKNLFFIGIGKQAINYLNKKHAITLATYDDLTEQQFISIAQAVTDLLLDLPVHYATTSIYSNRAKSFFVQQPVVTPLLPLVEPEGAEDAPRTEYTFEQSPELLRERLTSLLLSVRLQETIFESMLAEQAARFVSMDASTRNAENLLTAMQLDYNKVRQASITRELTELTSTL